MLKRAPEHVDCPHCGRRIGFGRCRSRACPGYLPTWAGDLAALLRDNVLALSPDATCDMVTITGAGAARLPWDTERCRALGPHRCSGHLGCVVQASALAAWNNTFADRLSMMLNAAREDVRRQWNGPKGVAAARNGDEVWIGDGEPFRMPPYVLMVEPQARGVLHAHMIFATPDRAKAHLLFRAIRRRSDRYGFGERVGWDPHRSNDRGTFAWAYVAKMARYLGKEAERGEHGHLLEVLRAMPGRRLARVSVTLTRRTRATMRNYRLRRWCWYEMRLPRSARLSPADAERAHLLHRLRGILRARVGAANALGDGDPPPWTVPPEERALMVALGDTFQVI